MNEDLQKTVRDMIARELGAAVSSPPTMPTLPSEMAPQAPVVDAKKEEDSLPTTIKLDEYEALLADSIKWREENINKTIALAGIERGKVADMKHALLQRCIKRNKIDLNKYNMSIDSGKKEIKIEKRG